MFEGNERLRFGSEASAGPHGQVLVRRPRFYRSVALGGSLGGAESYVEGDWDSDDLTAVVRLMARNRAGVSRLDGGLARLGELLARVYHWRRANTQKGSSRNILAHYDLGNELFERFLDPTMT